MEKLGWKFRIDFVEHSVEGCAGSVRLFTSLDGPNGRNIDLVDDGAVVVSKEEFRMLLASSDFGFSSGIGKGSLYFVIDGITLNRGAAV